VKGNTGRNREYVRNLYCVVELTKYLYRNKIYYLNKHYIIGDSKMKSEFIPSISSYIKYEFQDNCRKGFPIYNPNISSFYEYIFQMHLYVCIGPN